MGRPLVEWFGSPHRPDDLANSLTTASVKNTAGAAAHRWGCSVNRTDSLANSAQPRANASKTMPVRTFSFAGMNGAATRTNAITSPVANDPATINPMPPRALVCRSLLASSTCPPLLAAPRGHLTSSGLEGPPWCGNDRQRTAFPAMRRSRRSSGGQSTRAGTVVRERRDLIPADEALSPAASNNAPLPAFLGHAVERAVGTDRRARRGARSVR